MSDIRGKSIALAGTFTTLGKSHSDIATELDSLGAIYADNFTQKTDILVYGDMPGEALEEGRARNAPWNTHTEDVEIRDEAWLMEILSGEKAVVEPLEGPLSDFIARLDNYVETLRENPNLKVGYYRRMPASAAHLDKLANAWEVDRFSDDIRNLYRQADGFVFFWADKNHPSFQDRWATMKRRYSFDEVVHQAGREDPSAERCQLRPQDMEHFPSHLGGVCWMLPSADALKRSKGYYDYNFGDGQEEEKFFGRTMTREALESRVRVFDLGMQYHPVAFFMEDGVANPPVLVADDYSIWPNSAWMTFEDYMESLLNRHFTGDVRGDVARALPQRDISWQKRMPPMPLDDLLHEPEPTVDTSGGTFEVSVEEAGPCDITTARGIMIHTHSSWFWRGAAALGLVPDGAIRDHYNNVDKEFILNSDIVEVRNQVAQATSDIQSMDMKRVKKVAASKGFSLKKKTKTAFKEAMFADLTEPLEHVVVRVRTTFDLQALRVPKHPRADLILYGSWCSQARKIATRELETMATVKVTSYARDNMRHCGKSIVIEEDELSFVFDILVEPGHEIEVGQTFRVQDEPREFNL